VDLNLPLFFMHVPKCAGTAVVTLLTKAFRDDEICPAPPQGTWCWRAREVPGYRLYWGHFSADFLEEMGQPGTRLIMLRHHLERVVSLYDYWRSHRWEHIKSALPPHPYNGPAIAKSGNLSDFLSSDVAFVHEHVYNPAARQLLGRRFNELWPNEDAIIAEGVQALRGFAWVGITESFEPSIALLSRMLGSPVPKSTAKVNSLEARRRDDPVFEPIEQTEPTKEQCRRIAEGNRIDSAIYDEGRNILNERLGSSNR